MSIRGELPVPLPMNMKGDLKGNWKFFKSQWTSSYTFGYRRTAEIFKTPPFIYSIFLKTIPIHIFSVENSDLIIYFIACDKCRG